MPYMQVFDAIDAQGRGVRKAGHFTARSFWGKWLTFAILVLLAQIVPLSAMAQFDTAVVLGAVTDPSGAAIAGAEVTLKNTELGTVQVKKTSRSGDYEFPGIQIGSYAVSVAAQGFAPVTTDSFDVTVSARQRANIVMHLGSLTQDVTISAGTTGLETDTSDRSLVIERKQIVDLPLNGREYTDLALLAPGVQISTLEDGSVNQRRSSFVVNGMRSSANNFLLDGLDNNSYQIANQGFNNQAVAESADAVQEFRVQTSNFQAEFGRAAGAVVNVSTRSGTKDFHGSAWEYARNTAFDAYGPFLGTGEKPTLIQNQFGATLGGPIWRRSTFFFLDYEGFRQISKSFSTSSLPTMDQRKGVFYNEAGIPVPLVNPYTGAKYTNGVIPDADITPFAKAVLADMPAASISGFANNYTYLARGTNLRDIGDVRLDHYFGSKIQSFLRLSKQSAHITIGPPFLGPAGGGGSGHTRVLTSQIATGVTYTVSPHFLVDGRLGFTWTESGKLPYNYGVPNYYSKLNIPYPVDPIFGTAGLNTQTVSGYTAFGTQASDNQYTSPNTINPKISFTLDKQKHSISFGYEYLALAQGISTNNPIYGADTYSGAFSQASGGPASSTASKEAVALADFLFGARSSYELSNRVNLTENIRFHYAYGEDSWKILRNLTLNYGLRYEFTVPQWESGNRISNFDPTTNSLVLAKNGSMASRSLVNPQWNNWAPRFGFSYSPHPKMVLRGGYGISYLQYNRYGGEASLDQNGPYAIDTIINQLTSQPLCPAGSASFSCFRPTMQGYPTNMIEASAFSTAQSQTRYIPKDSPTGYIQSFSFGTQLALTPQTVLDIAYVGSRSKHLRILGDYNEASPQPVGGKTLSLAARRPIQTFTDIFDNIPEGYLKYDSLQVKIQHQVKDLFIVNSFTWSKAFDLAAADLEAANGDSTFVNFDNIKGDAGLSGYNQPLNDSLAVNWDIPYGKSITLLHGSVRQAVSGWQISAINRMTSGLPMNLNYNPGAKNITTNLAYNFRPNITGSSSTIPLPRSSWTKTDSAYTNTLNQSQISAPDVTVVYGNSRRNSLVGPAYYNLDLGLHKTFTLPERLHLEFRAEAFNLLNKTNLKSPTLNFSNAGFGQYTSGDAFPSRELQFAVRIVY